MNPSDPQADALARWLEAHPGADPPDELDPDVVEAVYMLRPDLAPAPRVSADDILAGFGALPMGGTSADDAATVEPAPVVPSMPSSVADAPATPRPANRRAVWAALGSVAAMAAAVLVVAQVALNGASTPMDAAAPLASAPEPSEVSSASRQAQEPMAGMTGTAQQAEQPSIDPAVDADAGIDGVADLGEMAEDATDDAYSQGLEEVSQLAEATGTGQANGVTLGGVSSDAPPGGAATGGERLQNDGADFFYDGELDAVADVGLIDPVEEEEADAEPAPGFPDIDFDIPMAAPVEPEMRDETMAFQDVVAEVPVDEPAQDQPESLDRVAAAELEGAPALASRGGRRRDREPPSPMAVQRAEPSSAYIRPPPEDSSQQARGRAMQLAAAQQFSDAFDVLAPYVSPSAPIVLVLDAAQYAFAAARWDDVVAVTTPRLNSPQAGDTAQQRARLFDLQARAQAMQVPVGQPTRQMDSMQADPQ